VRLALQGKLPTPPIIATLGISLVEPGPLRPRGFSGRMAIQSPRIRAWRLALRTARLRARLRGPNRAARRLRVYHARFACSVLSPLRLPVFATRAMTLNYSIV
jgi:hypothetical protein